jgi:hypothetical protein
MLVSCLAYPLTLKLDAACSSEITIEYIPEEISVFLFTVLPTYNCVCRHFSSSVLISHPIVGPAYV